MEAEPEFEIRRWCLRRRMVWNGTMQDVALPQTTTSSSASLHERIALYTLPAPAKPRSVDARAVVLGVTLSQEFLQKLLEVAVDSQVRLNRGLMELGRVDI